MLRVAVATVLALNLITWLPLAPSPSWGVPEASAEEIDAKKKADIVRLLEITGAAELGAQILGQMLESFKAAFPDVPASFWEEFRKRAKFDELIEEMIPVYASNFTHGEIKDLIKFYQTKTGKKVITVMPKVTGEAMGIGQRWGEKLATRIVDEVQAREAGGDEDPAEGAAQ